MAQEKKKTQEFQFNPDTVYEVVSHTDDSVLVALLPQIVDYENRFFVVWFDTVKERIKEMAKLQKDSPDTLAFITPQNEDYLFRKLTMENFNRKVAPKLTAPNTAWKITNEEEMVQFLMESLQNE